MKTDNPVTTAIVLCAGRGKRLAPHTNTTPKPLLAVNGTPTLDYILASLQHAGIERVVLVTHYLSEQLDAYALQQQYFATNAIECVRQYQLNGTAAAALAALDSKPEWFGESFLLTASDYLVPLPFYSALLEVFGQSNKSIAVSLKRIPEAELALRSSVRFNQRGDVLEVVEKPALGTAPSRLSANLVFVLPADIVEAIRKVQLSSRGEMEIQSAINGYLEENGPGCSLEQDTPNEWQPDLR